MEKRKQVVILAAGDFPTHPVPLQALHEADLVVCCDSAYVAFRQKAELRAKDCIVIGDGDSLPEADKQALGDRWLHVAEQDYNDLHKAMAYAAAHHDPATTRFTIVGATGRREDHTLGNISYLATFAEEYPDAAIEMLTDHGRLCALRGSRTFASFPRQQISIFSLNPEAPICGSGLKWPLEGFRARRWWQATLNEAVGSEFTLSCDDWLLLFRTHAPKG